MINDGLRKDLENEEKGRVEMRDPMKTRIEGISNRVEWQRRKER